VRLPFLALCALLLSAGPSQAQSQQTESSIRIERSVGVTTMARMAFAADDGQPRPGETSLAGQRESMSSAPAVIKVTGDPGRAYRINLPASLRAPMSNATITRFHVWSANAGDISETLTSHMDREGQDTSPPPCQ
jgi:hypothetical protein